MFLILFLLEGWGRGSPRRHEGAGGRFSVENPTRGEGVSHERGGGKGPDRAKKRLKSADLGSNSDFKSPKLA